MDVIKNCLIAVERSLPFILAIKSGFHRMGKHTLRDLLLALRERGSASKQLQLDDFIDVAAT
jgi:hypothetical protein